MYGWNNTMRVLYSHRNQANPHGEAAPQFDRFRVNINKESN